MNSHMALEAKVRRIGTGYGILIPKKKLEEIGAKEGDRIVIKRIEKSVGDIRGMLKGSSFRFRQGDYRGQSHQARLPEILYGDR
jgi:bifunctional DNA-binding transcriptional regulator/antitoxin component of YhaV-PrlF toxin-antitoxin module